MCTSRKQNKTVSICCKHYQTSRYIAVTDKNKGEGHVSIFVDDATLSEIKS